jgi:hypothetical protein
MSCTQRFVDDVPGVAAPAFIAFPMVSSRVSRRVVAREFVLLLQLAAGGSSEPINIGPYEYGRRRLFLRTLHNVFGISVKVNYHLGAEARHNRGDDAVTLCKGRLCVRH